MALRKVVLLSSSASQLKLNGNGSGATSGSVVLAVGSWLWRFVAFGFKKMLHLCNDENNDVYMK